MIKCPVCGFRNPDSNERCFRCSGLLKRDDEGLASATASAARKTRRHFWRNPLRGPVDWFVHRPWVRNITAVPEDGRFRYPFTAGLLSLIPGAGHWYAGQRVKAFIIFVLGIAFATFALYTIHATWSNYLLLSMLLLWLIVWADSVSVTEKTNGNTWAFRKTLALFFGAMMLLGVSVTVLQYLGIGIVSLEKVTANGTPPAIRHGDRLLFTSVPYWYRGPRLGEIVMFNPPRFTAEQDLDIYSINIRKYFQRVAGLPGDTISKRGGHFYRNGTRMQPDTEPLNGSVLPDFEIKVPEGSYFVPVTTIPRDILTGLSGAGVVPHVGAAGFVFPTWPKLAIIPEGDIRSKGLATIDPPPRRQWLN